MATLQVRPAFYSATKRKALEDAVRMQETVDQQLSDTGQEPPPYRLDELIGKGSFGRVYKAVALKTNMQVAVKIINIEQNDTADPKLADTFREFLAEVNALKLLNESGAKNINHVIDALPVGQSMWMITEYCAGGSVATLMRPTAPGGLQEKWIIPILREVAEAIYWVHRQGIIHRDIKCANVLVTESGGVQLCDFGVAGIIETQFDKRTTFIGTPHWMAPELFDQDKSYGTEVDIWALGSLVYEIASGLPPYAMAGLDIYQLGNQLKANAPRLYGDQYSDQLKSLVAYCLEEDPRQRPTIEQVQAHPYIHNTSQQYPTSSLSMLVKGYKMWESQGNNRTSLFAPGGAQGPSDVSDFASTALAKDEWNFSTTLAFDEEVLQEPDAQAVFDVYGSNVDFDPSEIQRQSKPKSRRRPPPQQLAAMKAPLEKVFDPNTISNYEDNSRAYYGNPIPPPASDLPLRDESSQSATVRESLIDLDASLHGAELSSFVDMSTIRAGEPRTSVDDYNSDGHEYNKPPLSDPADMNPNRRTQDWKFPSMAPPASANPEVFRFPFNDDGSGPSLSAHHFDEPSYGAGDGFDTLGAPNLTTTTTTTTTTNNNNNRESMSSLIDLDMGLVDLPSEYTRPSTSHSEAGSLTGSEMGFPNPFDLEKHASIYLPSTNREPSIYVSDEFASPFTNTHQFTDSISGLAISNTPHLGSSSASSLLPHQLHRNHSLSGSSVGGGGGSNSSNSMSDSQRGNHPFDAMDTPTSDYPDESEYLTPQTTSAPRFDDDAATPQPQPQPQQAEKRRPRLRTPLGGLEMPLPPLPPSLEVMQGQADSAAVKEEIRRLTMSMGEHLTCINQFLSSLSAPPARNNGLEEASYR
ncbi:kinase-like protein [Sodiomyces alkalinus F11]|uniref:non-specific serine/threonine protein kinase n=1 Tax=Sodiomyces alkalinus (strain CBS 110278 / VKM F-3762 / F11) TaxID=1314773 RepID=A0A3N2PS10_SODAK|nr:kinase-like protein [Sodiomyces alkalinus F11]ROT37250.1 kinase-like protein [Sodiomyces alkalinus F11]